MSGANEKRRVTVITDYLLEEAAEKKQRIREEKNPKNVLKNLSLWWGSIQGICREKGKPG